MVSHIVKADVRLFRWDAARGFFDFFQFFQTGQIPGSRAVLNVLPEADGSGEEKKDEDRGITEFCEDPSRYGFSVSR